MVLGLWMCTKTWNDEFIRHSCKDFGHLKIYKESEGLAETTSSVKKIMNSNIPSFTETCTQLGGGKMVQTH
jgi:hypothetical protein